MTELTPTRRRMLRAGVALGAGGLGLALGNPAASDEQASPFVSESASGDRDWNGGKWTTSPPR